MEINRDLVKRVFATLVLLLAFLIIFPITVLAATNYGDGTYGGGNYNVGDTPVPAATSAPTSNSSSVGAPQCTDTTPTGIIPWLYEANAKSGSEITLRFTNWQSPVDHFALEYGTGSNNYQFAAGNIGGNGTNSYTINSLSPNTTYYFRVRAGNGCAAGSWSNELSAKTLGSFSTNNLNITNTTIEPVSSQANPTPALKGTSQKSTTPTPTLAEGYKVNIKVKDTKGNAVENATVTLHSTPQTQKTNKDGIVTFTNVEQGNHTVDIAYNNYQGEQSINLTGDVKEFNVNVTIEPKNIFLSPQVLAVVGVLVLIIAFLAFRLAKKSKLRKL